MTGANSSWQNNEIFLEGAFPPREVYYGNDSDLSVNVTFVEDYYIFDRQDVRAIFITLYTIVFSFCFFGNLLVILVVTLSRRLRSITNFFLANLAVADLCVGTFCVFQNLSTYLCDSWVLGDTMCKLYQFVHSLSYTASIFILVVICTERYFAIIHPITCKQILTPTRLVLVIVVVWLMSAAYSAPRFFWVRTFVNHLDNNVTETICAPQRNKYNSKLFDVINFAVLYLAPLCVMTVLYSLIAAGLWRSSRVLRRPCGACAQRPASVRFRLDRDSQVSVRGGADRRPCVTVRGDSSCRAASSSHNVLRARRGVVRMLIVVVLTFALCNLPFHARKMWQYWSPSYHGSSTFSKLFTPLTFLVTYFNSGVNPLLYAFMSRNFRKGMRELLCCALREPAGAKASRRSSTRSTVNSAVLRSSLRLPRRRAEAGELVRSRSERAGAS
ncbi:trissin receptor-like [Bacillus rossius redtenbacheri]|uniref:trissin receptor-like n=1 Tax=Bacillus rossius redtenbacheri TaxID=93214 RepID=UPI002FDD24FD